MLIKVCRFSARCCVECFAGFSREEAALIHTQTLTHTRLQNCSASVWTSIKLLGEALFTSDRYEISHGHAEVTIVVTN